MLGHRLGIAALGARPGQLWVQQSGGGHELYACRGQLHPPGTRGAQSAAQAVGVPRRQPDQAIGGLVRAGWLAATLADHGLDGIVVARTVSDTRRVHATPTLSAERDGVAGDQGCGVGSEVGDDAGDLLRAGDVDEGLAPRTASRTASVTQPVSVTGGCTMFAVIPCGASSTAADMV